MEKSACHSVDLLKCALKLAEKQGIRVREETTPSGSNGLCRVGNQRYLFLDPSLPASQQLSEVMQALSQASGQTRQLQ